jgi:hypothetical protein
MDILALLQPIEDGLSKATLHQMSRVILAMLAMTGRVTMLGLSPMPLSLRHAARSRA